MRSAAAAFAWEFRQRHRWALVAAAIYVCAVGAYRVLFEAPGTTIRFDPPDPRAGLLITPLSYTFFYFLAVFSFGLAGDLASRQSIYPARMFSLPITTRALAGWPMLYGAAAMSGLWIAAWTIARWWGLHVPLVWPGLLGIAFMAWTQVFMWKAYGVRGLRVLTTVAWLIGLDVIVIVAVQTKIPEAVLVAFLAPQLPLAYLAACVVLARARRGDLPDWRLAFRRALGANPPWARKRTPFRSPSRAQVWFEWRRHGWTLPALTALVVPAELSLLFLPGNDVPSIVFGSLIVVLLTPPFLAGFTAAMVSRANPFARDSYGLPPFVATRPLSNAALIAAKLEMALRSTVATWLVIVVAIAVGLAWSGTSSMVVERATRFDEAVGDGRAIVIAGLVWGALFASTWKRLVQNLCIGLTGRAWLIKGSVFASLAFVAIAFPALLWTMDHGRAIAWLWDSLPWILLAMVSLKIGAASWIAVRLERGRLLSDRSLITGAACWVIAVFLVYGVFVWLADTPLIPHYALLLVAILLVPLVRVSAAPLALAWNRHR